MKLRWFFALLVIFGGVRPATAASGHESILFVIDVSSTVSGHEQLPRAARIAWDINQRLPAYVKNAGLLTFGNLHAPQLDWVVPLGPHDREVLAESIQRLRPGQGPTPLGAAVGAAGAALGPETGKTAIVIVSDGIDNGGADPAGRVRELKAARGDQVCVFTIALGDDGPGAKLLERMAAAGSCGRSVKASSLEKGAQVQALVDLMFPPLPRPRPLDADRDGVPDERDRCPDTPAGASADGRGCWVIPDLNFEPGQSEVPAEQRPQLDRVAQVLKAQPELIVAIEGHTDSQGSEECNQRLSQDRAASVRDYLVESGIEPSRLSAAGYGETRPAFSDDTAEGMARNRRIEIRVIE